METNLFRLRTKKKVSQSVVAELLGVSRQAYSRYERNEHELGYEALSKLANYFDCSVDYLIGHSTYYYPDRLAYSEAGLSDPERELLLRYRQLRPDLQELLLSTAKTWTDAPASEHHKKA